MANRSPRYICPDCGRKTVYFTIGRTYNDGSTVYNEDGFYCAWHGCGFNCYSHDQAPPIDHENMKRLAAVNPQAKEQFVVGEWLINARHVCDCCGKNPCICEGFDDPYSQFYTPL